jgi:hypothetical protein
MKDDLVSKVKSLEKNSLMNIELGARHRYCKKHLIPLVREIDVFTKHNTNWKEDDFKFIAERMKFQFFKAGEDVFEYNDYGNLFYIIIQGTCAVLIPHNTNPLLKNKAKQKKTMSMQEKSDC